jgi:hypothetical protein
MISCIHFRRMSLCVVSNIKLQGVPAVIHKRRTTSTEISWGLQYRYSRYIPVTLIHTLGLFRTKWGIRTKTAVGKTSFEPDDYSLP